ncbi:MAG: alpha-amylase family glycosyl hydrolase [Actinomycetota bacterium]|nr:alpha-amylase family glycosyl hydrolase [Actinomycetota bacterium]
MALAWWQHGVIYQLYPRSFQDSDGTGTGDIRGIISRLDYFVWLGIDAVWISPIYPSPMTDFGYDVSDYCDVDPLFGTLADMDALITAAHDRGLKVILDYVPNHSSDQHPWFIESRRDRTSPKRDWYLWHDGAASGGPPNNWLSNFGGTAWTWDEGSGQYYYHSFLPTQPDLNWRNPAVRTAMFAVLRFWLRRGVDGFRVDVMWMLIKDDQLRDNPPNPDYRPGGPSHDQLIPLYVADRPEVLEAVAAMRSVLDEEADRVLIGELYLPIDRLMAYYGEAGRGAQLPFNFQLLLMQDWHAATIADIVTRYEARLPPDGWPNWVLGNHDRPRIASRVGPAQARVAALLLLTLRGTPTIYMGDELGMVDTAIPEAEVRDPAEQREPGKGLGRDPERTPFPWKSGPGAGFTTGKPWLRIGADTPLSVQRNDPASMVSLYRALLELRRQYPALSTGAISDVAADKAVLSFRRSKCESTTFAVMANLGHVPIVVEHKASEIILSTCGSRIGEQVAGTLSLRADEAVILRLKPT